MKIIDYDYFLELYNDEYNTSLTMEEFIQKFKKTNIVRKAKIMNKILKSRENEIEKILDNINNYASYNCQEFENVKTKLVYSVHSFVNKVKQYDNIAKNLLESLNINKIIYYKRKLCSLKREIKDNEKYSKLIEEIDFLLDELNGDNIKKNIDYLEDEFIDAIENIDRIINDESNILKNSDQFDNLSEAGNENTINVKPLKKEDIIKSEEFNHRENNMKNEIIPYSQAYSIKDEKNKKVNNITNKYEICEDEKYTEYLNNSLMYFDVVKLRIYSYNLDEVEEQNILKYLDTLKNEYIYLFTKTLDYNDKKIVLKMLKSLDSLISKKVEKKEKIYTKKAA